MILRYSIYPLVYYFAGDVNQQWRANKQAEKQ
jgi:hypothetical protein